MLEKDLEQQRRKKKNKTPNELYFLCVPSLYYTFIDFMLT